MPLVRLFVLVAALGILITPLTTAVAQTESRDATTLGAMFTPTSLPTFITPLAPMLWVMENLPNTVTGGSRVTSNRWKAMLFTTGSDRSMPKTTILGLNPPIGSSPTVTVNVELA